MTRYGAVLRIKAQEIEAYKPYHRAVWSEVLHTTRNCNIRNYSIFLKDDLLFGYYEYHGADYAADMAKIGGKRENPRMVGANDADATANRHKDAG